MKSSASILKKKSPLLIPFHSIAWATHLVHITFWLLSLTSFFFFLSLDMQFVPRSKWSTSRTSATLLHGGIIHFKSSTMFWLLFPQTLWFHLMRTVIWMCRVFRGFPGGSKSQKVRDSISQVLKYYICQLRLHWREEGTIFGWCREVWRYQTVKELII